MFTMIKSKGYFWLMASQTRMYARLIWKKNTYTIISKRFVSLWYCWKVLVLHLQLKEHWTNKQLSFGNFHFHFPFLLLYVVVICNADFRNVTQYSRYLIIVCIVSQSFKWGYNMERTECSYWENTWSLSYCRWCVLKKKKKYWFAKLPGFYISWGKGSFVGGIRYVSIVNVNKLFSNYSK